MKKPTLLFVEEYESTLSRSVMSNRTINLVLLRFKQNMSFSQKHLDKTSNVPCFIFDKTESVGFEVERFKRFCTKNKIVIDYFYNDSEYNQEIIQKFASTLELLGSLDEYQSRCVRDKAVMKDKLKELGFKTVPYQEIHSSNDAIKFAEENGGFPFIVKWRKCLSSKEVYKIESKDQLESLQLDYSTGRFIAEKYCPHLIWSFDSLIQDGEVRGTFLTWLPYTNLSFAEKKDKFAQITVSNYPDNIKFDGIQITQDIIKGIGLKNGYIEVEVFVDINGQPTICEIAWRTPGEKMLSNQSIAFGVDVCSLLTDIMVRRKIKKLPLKGNQCVGDMFLPMTEGTVTKISDYSDLADFEGVIDGEVTYKVGDVIESKRQYTSCAGWVQITGKNADEVLNRMLKVYDKFEIITK